MKKVFIGLLAFAAIAMTGCQNEINEGIEANKEGFKVFSGEIEQAEAENRTTLNKDGQVIWSGEEQINVFADASYNYTVASGEGTKEVTFGVVENGEGVPAEFEGTHYAVYPYSTNHSVDAEGVFTLDMSGLAEQNAPAVDTYAHGAGYAIAQSTSTEFFFQNVLAAMDVEFSLEGNNFAEMITIEKIVVTSNDGYYLTGTATAKVGEAAVINANGGNQITYTVEGATIDADTKYNCIIMVPAVAKENFTGLTLRVEGENAYTGTPYFWEGIVPANAVKFERNKVTYLKKQIKPIEVEQVFVSNFEQLQATVDAITTTNQVIINMNAGVYDGALDVTGGKNIVLQPATEGADVVLAGLDHQSNGTPSTVVVNNITFDNSIEIEGWFTGTSQNMKPCVGFWGGDLTFNECKFYVSGASKEETGIMSWWTTDTNPAKLTLNSCDFISNNDSARAAQIYGKVDVTVNECDFNTPYRYGMKLVLQNGYEAVLSGNTVNNATSFVELGAASYAGNNYKVTFADNTLASDVALYVVANYENQTVVEGAETKFYAADTEGINSYLNGAASPAAIYLADGTYNLTSLAINGKTFSLTGESRDGVIIQHLASGNSNHGDYTANVTFNNLTFKNDTGDYGDILAKSVTYNDCIYIGTMVTYSPEVYVNHTDFIPAASEFYNVHIYGEGSTKFYDCSFTTTACRSVYAFSESAKEFHISFDNCTFKTLNQLDSTDSRFHPAIRLHTEYGIHGTLTIDDTDIVGDYTFGNTYNDGLWVEWNNQTKVLTNNFTVTVGGEKVWPVEKSAVETLNELIAAGESTITLTEDVVFEEGEVLTIPAGSEVTIDLGGKTMSAVNAGTTTTNNMIENKGKLTLTNGTIDYKDATVMTAAVNYASNTIDNASGATLTIEEGVVIENNSDASVATYGYPHCINNEGTLFINGGTFTNSSNYSTIRIWCTEDDDTNVTINGGTFNGCIDFQTPNAKGNKGTLTITGGTFNGDTYSNNAVRLLGFGTDVDEMVSEISGGTFNQQIKITNYVGGEMNAQVFFVSGGKFNVEPTGFLAENCVTYVDGDYYVAAPMADAMQAASEIRVSNEIDLAKVSLNGYTGTITGVGEAAALSTRNYTVAANANEFYNIQNSTITFQNIDLLFPTADIDFLQTGIVGKSSTFTLNNCDIEGQFTLNGNATWNFNKCDFVSTEEGAYCSFVYGATKATFTQCDFKGVDRAAKVYGSGGNLDVVYDNCTFTSTNTNKAAINIDATYATTTVAINNGCSQTNMNGLYAVEGTKATVTIDGKTPIADGVMLNAEGEYEISNAAGLAWFGNEVNVNNKNFSGKTVKLVEDITLTEAWTPVGQTGATQFTGSFDGQDHTIYGLTINAPASYDSNDAAGFFGWLESYSGSVIKNIKFDGATIAGYHYVGTVAGYVSGGTEISGCEVTNSTIAALSTVMTSDTNEYRGDKVGGIVGFTNSNNKINNNKVSKTQITGYRQIGGIAGYLYASANGNSIEEVTINVCNDQNTENFTVRNEYGVGSLFGVTAGTATNNTGEATINWGEIPAAFKVVNNAGWDKVYLYAWQGENKILGEWPGVEISNGYAAIPAEYVGETVNFIINNNNGIQTADLKVEKFEDNFTHTIGDPDPETITIYLNNNWSVKNLKLYTWEPALWGDTAWETGQKTPTGTVTTDWGTFTYWDVPASAIATDKVGNLLVTGTDKQTADLENVDYSKDVYLEFNWTSEKGDHLVVKTTPY